MGAKAGTKHKAILPSLFVGFLFRVIESDRDRIHAADEMSKVLLFSMDTAFV